MSKTLTKKIVGMGSFAVAMFGALAQFATAEHIAIIRSVLPSNPTVNLILSFLVAIGMLWGKHLGSSPSVADALKEGTLSQEVANVNASS